MTTATPTHDLTRSTKPLWLEQLFSRAAAIPLIVVVTFVTFFIVEHSLTMSLTSEDGGDAEFVEVDLDTDAESGSTLRKLGFLGFGALGFVLLALPGPTLNWASIIPWVAIAFVGWLMASVTWSADSGLCVRRVIVVALMTLGMMAWLRLMTPEETTRWLGRVALVFLALGVVCEVGLFQFRPWQSGFRFGGTTHPNTLGVLAAMATFYAAVRAHRPTETRRVMWLVLAIVSLGLLYLTKSRTALAAAMLTVGLVWALRTTWPNRLVAALFGSLAATAIVFVSVLFDVDAVSSTIDALLLGRSEQVTTLTGRTPLWAELNRDIAESPALGYGFGSFWTPDVLYRVKQNQGWQIPHAHSGYYETTLNLGLLGLGLVLLTLTAAWWRSVRADSPDNIASGMTIATITFAAIYSVTDTAFALPTFASFSLAALALQASRMTPALPLTGHAIPDTPAAGSAVRWEDAS